MLGRQTTSFDGFSTIEAGTKRLLLAQKALDKLTSAWLHGWRRGHALERSTTITWRKQLRTNSWLDEASLQCCWLRSSYRIQAARWVARSLSEMRMCQRCSILLIPDQKRLEIVKERDALPRLSDSLLAGRVLNGVQAK